MTYRTIIKFIVPGEALTKGNAQSIGFNRRTKKPIFFGRSKRILAYEASFTKVISALNLTPSPAAIKVTLTYYLKTRKRKDLGNLPKSTLDLMINHAYLDDSQICEMIMFKYYDPKNPRVEIVVEEILGEDSILKKTYPLTFKNEAIAGTGDEVNKPVSTRKKKRTTNTSNRGASSSTGNVHSHTKGKKTISTSTSTSTARTPRKTTSLSTNKTLP